MPEIPSAQKHITVPRMIIGVGLLVNLFWLIPVFIWTQIGGFTAQPSSPDGWHPCRVREVPLRFPVRRDLQSLVTDQNLRMVLETVIPRWDPPTVPIMLHALRLWGPDARFPVIGDLPSGINHCEDFRRILLNNAECVRVVGHFDEFLSDTRYGARVLTSGDPIKVSTNSEGHCDQLLKVLGECGIRASEPITTSSGRVGKVEDLLQDSMARFSLEQEMEFSAIAFARWIPPVRRWTNRFGEVFTFDDMIQALIETPIGEGSCQGCHAPFALTYLLLANDQIPDLISEASRSKLEQRLREISHLLETNELPNGGWDKHWTGRYVENKENVFFEFKPHFDRISATGHHLEWIALVPAELRPGRGVVERSVRALIAEIAQLANEDLDKPKGYLPLSHAARALCLLRGQDHAFPIWLGLQVESR